MKACKRCGSRILVAELPDGYEIQLDPTPTAIGTVALERARSESGDLLGRRRAVIVGPWDRLEFDHYVLHKYSCSQPRRHVRRGYSRGSRAGRRERLRDHVTQLRRREARRERSA